MKVVWICHFSDEEVQEKLGMRKTVTQFAPWITHTIPIFENRNDIELHVISPHEYIQGTREFEKNSVHYHFFNPFIPVWGRHWPRFFRWDQWTNYASNKRILRHFVAKIKPDLIHLQGLENPYYSVPAIQFLGKYPFVVNLQRLKLDEIVNKSNYVGRREAIENFFYEHCNNFTIRTKNMLEVVLKIKPKANIYWANYSIPELNPKSSQNNYDIVFFARVCREKGIEDLFNALKFVKEKFNETKLSVIGPVSKPYLRSLKNLAAHLDISSNIVWKGMLPSLLNVHQEASQARISVLPTHNDIISGTIIESMQLGLPVVSYKVGSIPELNEEQENVLLVEKGDIEGLARNIIRLLTDEELYSTMAQRGIDCIKQKYNNENVRKQHIECYRKVIQDFYSHQDA